MAGDLIDPGTGGAGGASGLRTMWRTVYRKAVEAAEPRIRALLQEHVYSYHLGLGGAGGGNWVLVETRTLAVSTVAQVDFAAVPAAGAGLVLVVSAHSVGGGGGAGTLILRLNDDATTNYSSAWHELFGVPGLVPTHSAEISNASYLPLGRMSIADGTNDPTGTTAGVVAFLPGHGLAGRRKQVLTLGAAFTQATRYFHGAYGGEWRGTGAVTKLSLLPTSGTFGAGSVFTLYVLTQTAARGAAAQGEAAQGEAAQGGAAGASAPEGDALAALEARVAALEARA